MKYRALFLVLFCFVAAFFVPQGLVAKPHVFFGPPINQSDKGLEEHFLEFINTAQKSLDACFFDVKSAAIVQAFIDAHNRGVKVRFVTDDERFFFVEKRKVDKSRHRDTIQAMLDAGIVIKQDGRSPLMHNKFCIKDERYVWTGSYNITEPGNLYNFNNALWVDSPELAEIYRREMDEMFERGEFGGDSTSDLGRQEADDVDGTHYEVLFAPEDDPNARILELVRNATDEIYFMHYAFTHHAIGDACVEKFIDGLKVEGLFDHLLYRSTGPNAQFNKFCAVGVPVSVIRPHKGIQHNKVFILDPHTDHGIVITGSLNISDNGGDQNDENTLVIHDSETALKYFQQYETRKNQFSDDVVAEVLCPELPTVGSVLPLLQLHIVTNGKSVQTVSVEFAARWKIKQDIVDNLKVFRGKREITGTAMPRYKSNRLVFSNIDLKAKGDERSLLIQFTDVPAPRKAAGIYTFYIKTGEGDDNLDLQPIRTQPTIEFFKPGEDARIMSHRLAEFDEMLDSLLALDEQAQTEEEQRGAIKNYQEQFAGIENIVTAEILDGRYDRLLKLCEYCENAQNHDSLIFKAIMHKLLILRKIVLGQSIYSDDQELLALAKRMHALCVKYLDSVSPLAPR